MTETPLPLAPELWAALPAPAQAPLQEKWATLRLENAALRTQNAALQARIRDLEARLGQTSSSSLPSAAALRGSRPPSLLPAPQGS